MKAQATIAAALALAGSYVPADAGCRLGLALGLDISASIDSGEYRLQREGLARALLSPSVERLFFTSGDYWVAIAVYEWSARRPERVLVDWTPARTRADLARAADRIVTAPYGDTIYPTALGQALGFGSILLRRAPDCARQTLDISGDGRNNHSYPPRTAYREFPFDGVTVNGLAILGAEPDIVAYYRDEVLHGPGAFVEVADDFHDFERAMRRKLERELGAPEIAMTLGHPRPDAGG